MLTQDAFVRTKTDCHPLPIVLQVRSTAVGYLQRSVVAAEKLGIAVEQVQESLMKLVLPMANDLGRTVAAGSRDFAQVWRMCGDGVMGAAAFRACGDSVWGGGGAGRRLQKLCTCAGIEGGCRSFTQV